MKRKAVFFDRDGTLNPDPGYINDPNEFNLFPGVPEALQDLKKLGYLLILVTNQSGLGRQLIVPRNLCLIHNKLQSELELKNASFDRIFLCPHKPEDGCECRKPKPGLALRAISSMNIDPSSSYMVGDKESDVQMAQAAGLRPILIGQKKPARFKEIVMVNNVRDAVNHIIERDRRKK